MGLFTYRIGIDKFKASPPRGVHFYKDSRDAFFFALIYIFSVFRLNVIWLDISILPILPFDAAGVPADH